ncbi:helix-turn-helix domain-containing protein [Nocardia sp. NPDC059691]|uniref:helix-turn-helix domain-containing protein n=1 Tax=Nocardia sp. NPDC059691 TaxID=3346908 RepID=UPI00368B79E0
MILDAADVLVQGTRTWTAEAASIFESAGPPVIVEHAHLVSEPVTTLLSRWLRRTPRSVVLTCVPGTEPARVPTLLDALCASRRELLPLRRRREDIPVLARRILDTTAVAGRVRLAPDTLRVLADQPWPGNLTELDRIVRAVAQRRSAGDITPADLPASHRAPRRRETPLRSAEREIIVRALEAAGGNRMQAARAIGVSRSTLYNRMRALRIE